MTNNNPTLIMGQVMDWLDKSGTDIRPHERQYVELRIYQPTGAGYFFTGARSAIRWYYKDSPDADHFCRADINDVTEAINRDARVQVCGSRGVSYGVWRTWNDFLVEVIK